MCHVPKRMNFAAAASVWLQESEAKLVSSNWVQRGGSEGVLEYNHMATVERLKNGTLVAAWQVRLTKASAA